MTSSIAEADNFDPLSNNTHGPVRLMSEESQITKPMRPREFRSFMVLPFVLLQVALAIVLGVLLHNSQPFGKCYDNLMIGPADIKQALSDHPTAQSCVKYSRAIYLPPSRH